MENRKGANWPPKRQVILCEAPVTRDVRVRITDDTEMLTVFLLEETNLNARIVSGGAFNWNRSKQKEICYKSERYWAFANSGEAKRAFAFGELMKWLELMIRTYYKNSRMPNEVIEQNYVLWQAVPRTADKRDNITA